MWGSGDAVDCPLAVSPEDEAARLGRPLCWETPTGADARPTASGVSGSEAGAEGGPCPTGLPPSMARGVGENRYEPFRPAARMFSSWVGGRAPKGIPAGFPPPQMSVPRGGSGSSLQEIEEGGATLGGALPASAVPLDRHSPTEPVGTVHAGLELPSYLCPLSRPSMPPLPPPPKKVMGITVPTSLTHTAIGCAPWGSKAPLRSGGFFCPPSVRIGSPLPPPPLIQPQWKLLQQRTHPPSDHMHPTGRPASGAPHGSPPR